MIRLAEIFRLRESPEHMWDAAFDRFPKTFDEFDRDIRRFADQYLGKGWEQIIDKVEGQGATKKGIRAMWDNNYTENEAVGNVGMWFDYDSDPAYGGGGNYGPLGRVLHEPKPLMWDSPDSDLKTHKMGDGWYDERPGRPIGVGKDGKMIFDQDEVPDL